MAHDYLLTHEEFWEIYKKVPRLTVEIIIQNEGGILLTLRDIEPCRDMWHLPGGTVRFGERLTEAVARIAKREVGITVTGTKLIGYIEYPSHYQNGLDTPVGIAFAITGFTGPIVLDTEAKDSGWFKEMPKNMHDEQREFLERELKL